MLRQGATSMLGRPLMALPDPRRCAAALAASSVLLSGCPKPGNTAAQVAEAPSMEQATGEAKCGVRKSAAKPLVVEWPAAERAALEARATRGLVAVRYAGCEMEVLTSCTAKGAYTYLGLTQKREGVRIRNADELYAELPVGAASLEGKLERAGQLNVDMVIVGRKETDRSKFNERDLDGRCDEATHVITGLTVGAFSFYSGKSAEVGAGAKIGNIGAGASSEHNQEVLKQDGNGAACADASMEDVEPPEGCGALLRVEVIPIDRIFESSKPVMTGTGGGGGPVDAGPPPDPNLDRKLRRWTVLYGFSYLALLGSIGGIYAGAFTFKSGKDKLKETKDDETRLDDRDKYFRRQQIGLGVLYGSIGLLVGGGVLLYFSARKVRDLKKQKRAAIAPTFGPGGGGLVLKGSF